MKKMILIAAFGLIAAIAIATTNEITGKMYLKVDKDYTQITRDSGSLMIQMAGTRYNSQIINATNGWTQFSKGSVASMGYGVMRNLSTNNTVYISLDAGITTNFTLKAGEMNMMRFFLEQEITNMVVRTTNSTCNTEFTIVEN